jgi:hypothetical protein
MAAGLAAQEGVSLSVHLAAPPSETTAIAAVVRPGGAIASVEVLENPSGARSAGLNGALAAVAADIVVRVDARSFLAPGHVQACVARLLADGEVGVVGGHQHPVAGAASVVARAVARVLSDPLASGGAAYRRLEASGPVDTVYLGAFRTAELRAIGGWSEDLEANEDWDLCQRYAAAGRVVWLEHGLDVAYEARATVGGLWRQYAAFGASKVRVWRHVGHRPQPRQIVGLVAPLGALGLLVGAALALPWAAVGALAGGLLLLAGLDRRRGATAPAGERALGALLTPLPATAFAAGALRALARPGGKVPARPR